MAYLEPRHISSMKLSVGRTISKKGRRLIVLLNMHFAYIEWRVDTSYEPDIHAGPTVVTVETIFGTHPASLQPICSHSKSRLRLGVQPSVESSMRYRHCSLCLRVQFDFCKAQTQPNKELRVHKCTSPVLST